MISARAWWGLIGVGILALAAAGAYFSLPPASQSEAPSARSAAHASAFPMNDAPQPLPALAFEDGEGRKRSLSEFRGKVVLLNLWATWCTPCRKEMPALDRLQQKLGGPDFEVVALSIDAAGAEAVKRFYEETAVHALAIYVDKTPQATTALRTVGIPTTLLVDRQGREIGRRTGPAEWDGPEVVRLIEARLKE